MANADTTAPVLTSLSLPGTISLSSGNAAVTATIEATDVGLGVDTVYIQLDRSFQSTYGRSYGFSLGSSDTFADGISSKTEIFTTETASGTYGIQSVTAYDKAGNYTIYYTADLQRLGFQTSFEVTGGGVADTTAPVLTSLSLPSTISLSSGNAAVTATIEATDVGLGVDTVYIQLDRSFQSTYGRSYGFSLGSSDTFADGISSKTEIFTTETASGTYGIQSVTAYDKAGNYTIYYTADLQRLGFQTSFEVTDIKFVNGTDIDDVLRGTELEDRIDGKAGSDSMTGLEGNDWYYVDNAGDRVFEAAGGGTDRVLTSVSYTLTAGQEIEWLGTTSEAGTTAINLTGNASDNTLVGNAGVNTLNGGVGADRLTGGAGNDSFIVDQAGDRVVEASGGGTDRVFASTSYVLEAGQEIEGLQLLASTGSANLNLTGNEISQSLVGNNGNNVIDGGVGRDAMTGRGGNDTYLVDNLGDRIAEAVGGGRDTVLTRASYALAAGQEVEALQLLTVTGTARLNLNGNEFAQSVVGNAGANVLDGKGGADVLTGRGGADSFLFSTALGTGNVDRITDFMAEDTVRLSKSVFSALAPGQLAGSAFKNLSAGSVDADDRILYKQATGELFYDADGSGGGVAVRFGVLDNKAALTAADFFVV